MKKQQLAAVSGRLVGEERAPSTPSQGFLRTDNPSPERDEPNGLVDRQIMVLEALSTCVLLVSSEGRLIEAAMPRPDLLHCELAQLQSVRFSDTFPAFLVRSVDGAIAEARRSTQPVQLEYTLKAVDGVERLYDVTFRSYGDELLIVIRYATGEMQAARGVVDAVRREQQRIGQDLHDGLGSHLTGVAMLVWGLARNARDGSSVDAEDLEEIASLINSGIEQARELARGLGPFRALDLTEALQMLCKSFRTRFHFPCYFSRQGPQPRLTKEETDQLFRIAQESLQNALKHAHASRVDVLLRTEADVLELVVQDDGVGMPDKPDDGSGLGLSILRYRARVIRATCTFEEAPGGGTVMRCVLRRPRKEASTKRRENKS